MSTGIKIEKQNNSLYAKNFSESGQGQYYFYVRGTGYAEGFRILILNNTTIYNTSGRGMRLTIFDTTNNMNITYDVNIDTYTVANVDILVTALQTITDTDVFVMTSYDYIRTNANLNTEMDNLGSWRWPSFYDGRNRYACIGLGKTGIQSEQLWHPGDPVIPAELTWNYQDYDSSGSVTYGPEMAGLLSTTVPEYSYTGTGYSMFASDYIYFDANNVGDGETVELSCECKIDDERKAAGGTVSVYMFTTNSSGGTTIRVAHYASTVGWVKVILRTIYNVGRGDQKFRVYVYHYPDSVNDGTSYIRNIEVYKAGYTPDSIEPKVRVSNHSISAKRIVESPLPFNPTDPAQYYKMWGSNQNLYKDKAYTGKFYGTGAVDEDVYWFNRTLTLNTEKFVNWKLTDDTIGENMSTTFGSRYINPDSMYYGAVWMKNFYKSAGNNYFGCNGYDEGTHVGILSATTGVNNTNPYQYHTPDESIKKGVWHLLEGWFLPRWTDNTYGTLVRNDVSNKEFGYVEDQGFHTAWTGTRNVWRFREDNNKLQLRVLDYYNNIYHTKTYWVLPLLIEVKPMVISKLQTLYSNELKESL